MLPAIEDNLVRVVANAYSSFMLKTIVSSVHPPRRKRYGKVSSLTGISRQPIEAFPFCLPGRVEGAIRWHKLVVYFLGAECVTLRLS